jgi:hypothetical protein
LELQNIVAHKGVPRANCVCIERQAFGGEVCRGAALGENAKRKYELLWGK